MKKTNEFPIIMVHGFLCWGEETGLHQFMPCFGMWNGNAKMTVLEQGITAWAPHVGPFSGMWDRACELYAMIKGGTVDYGKVHSEKNHHARYGRTYEARVPNWGELDEEGKLQKINIIGHSFGGPTVRTLIHLLAEGDAAEREGTPAEELSPLFEGGKEKWIHSCTTLAATHNGVTLPDAGRPLVKPMAYVFFGLGNLTSGTWFSKLYDFNLDRFGVSSREKHLKFNLNALHELINGKQDNIFWELSTEGAMESMKDYKTYDNIYYFSYAGYRTERVGGKCKPSKDMWLPLKPFALFTCGYKDADHDESWQPNDGLVNIPSAQYPLGQPHVDFEAANGDYKPGIWHVMPTEWKDHTSYMGVLEKKDVFKQFWIDIADRVSDLPVID